MLLAKRPQKVESQQGKQNKTAPPPLSRVKVWIPPLIRQW